MINPTSAELDKIVGPTGYDAFAQYGHGFLMYVKPVAGTDGVTYAGIFSPDGMLMNTQLNVDCADVIARQHGIELLRVH